MNSSINGSHEEDYEIDLRENYQNAVDCIIQCEIIIQSLQEQLASKEQIILSKNAEITSLEKTVLNMTLELASNNDSSSSAAREREQLLKSKDETIAGLEEKLIRMSLELASSKADQDEQLHRFKRRISGIESVAPDDDYFMQLPTTTLSRSASDFASSVRPKKSSTIRQRIRHQHPLSRSWSASDNKIDDDDDTVTFFPSPPVVIAPQSQTQAKQQRGFHKRMSWNLQQDASSEGSNKTGLDDSTISQNSGSNTAGRRLSSIGQFMLGLNKHNNSKVEASELETQVKMKNNGVVSSEIDSCNSPLEFTGRRRPSSDLSGVIFPVSSDDCLAGLCQDPFS